MPEKVLLLAIYELRAKTQSKLSPFDYQHRLPPSASRLPLAPSHTWPSRASGVQLSCALLCGFFLFVGAPCRPLSQSASQLASLLSPLSAFHLHLQRGDASLDDIDGCDSTPRGSQHVCNVSHSPPPLLIFFSLYGSSCLSLFPSAYNWSGKALR